MHQEFNMTGISGFHSSSNSPPQASANSRRVHSAPLPQETYVPQDFLMFEMSMPTKGTLQGRVNIVSKTETNENLSSQPSNVEKQPHSSSAPTFTSLPITIPPRIKLEKKCKNSFERKIFANEKKKTSIEFTEIDSFSNTEKQALGNSSPEMLFLMDD